MKTETYYCDRCKKQIQNIVYHLSCTATTLCDPDLDTLREVAAQNVRNTASKQTGERHLCRACKDKLTDGVFLV